MSRRRAYAGREALAVQPRPGRSCLSRAWTGWDEGGRKWEEGRVGSWGKEQPSGWASERVQGERLVGPGFQAAVQLEIEAQKSA